MSQKFFGKYRGRVTNNLDPLMLGRILVEVPAVSGLATNFAMPCTPYAGPNVGFCAIPPIGANVWIEFEGGDPNHPIWTGCFWGEGEIPEAATPGTQVFQTDSVSLVFNSLPDGGGFSLTCSPGGAAIRVTPDKISLAVNAVTITLDATSIKIAAPVAEIAGGSVSVLASNVEMQGGFNLEGPVTVSGHTIVIGGLTLVGGGTVDGFPLK